MPAALRAVACALAGSATGIAGAFVQADRLILGDVVVPWGMLLAVAAVVAVVRGSVWGMGSRAGGWLAFAGWLAFTVLLATQSPSGDLAISGGGRQWTYVIACAVLGAAAASAPALQRRGA